MSKGLQTTEFWVTVATEVGVVAAALQGSLPPKWAAIAAAVSSAAYGIARGLAKMSQTNTAPVVPAAPVEPAA